MPNKGINKNIITDSRLPDLLYSTKIPSICN